MAEVTDLITSSMYLARLGMISVDEATKGLTSTLKGFKLEASEAMDIVDKLTALDVKAATTAGEIATGLAQFANLGNLSGLSTDQAAAMVATIADVSQVSGSQAGNSIKMMLSRYGNVKSGKFDAMDGESDTEALNDVEKVLNKIGISMRDANNKFREFDDVLEDISDKWGNLDNISRNAVASAVAGTRQREAFLVLMENMDKYHDFTKIAENSEGTAYKKYLSYQEQLEASQKRLSAAWEELAQSSDVQQFLTTWNNFLVGAVKALPIILKYSARIFAAWNAYKIPTVLKSFGGFFGLTGENGFLSEFKQSGMRGAVERYNDKRINGDESQGFFAKLAGYKQQQLETERLITVEKEKQLKLSRGESVDSTEQAIKSQEEVVNKENVVEAGQQELASKRETASFSGRAKGNLSNGATMLTLATATLTSVLTAGGTNYNFAKRDGSTTEASSGAQAAQKATTGIATALVGVLGGAIGGPFGAMIGTTIGGFIGEALNPLIGGWIDADRDARNKRVEDAQEQLKQLKEINAAVSNLEDSVITSNTQTYEEYQKQQEAVSNMRSSLVENPDAAIGVAEYLRGKTFEQTTINDVRDLYTVMDRFDSLSPQEQKEFIQQYEIASKTLNSSAIERSLENNFEESKDMVNASSSMGYGIFDNDYFAPGTQMYATREYAIWADKAFGSERVPVHGEIFESNRQEASTSNVGFGDIHVENADPEELYNFNKDFYENFLMKQPDEYFGGAQERSEFLSDWKKNHIDSIKTAMNQSAQLNAQIDTARTEEGISKASVSTPWSKSPINISNLNARQLRYIGKDAIMRAVTQEISASGGLKGYDDLESRDAQAYIESLLKQNEDLYALFSGQSYTLAEALKKDEYEVLKNFANVLGVARSDLGKFDEQLGNLSLGQIIELTSSLEKARNYMSETVDLMSSLKTNGLTGENLEKLFSNYPELIQYANDAEALYSHLYDSLMGGNTLYGIKMQDQLLTDTTTYEQFFADLDEKTRNALNKKNISDGKQLATLLGLTNTEIAEQTQLSESQISSLRDKFNQKYNLTFENAEMKQSFDILTELETKRMDKQLENLNAQKEALQEINKQREYENKLIETQLKLADSAEQKKRVWREGVGWVYESDQGVLAEVEKTLEEVETEKQVDEIDMQINEISALREDLEHIAELLEMKRLEEISDAFINKFGLQMGDLASAIQTIANLENGRAVNLGYDKATGKAIMGYGAGATEGQSDASLTKTTVSGQNAVSNAAQRKNELEGSLKGNYSLSKIKTSNTAAYTSAITSYADAWSSYRQAVDNMSNYKAGTAEWNTARDAAIAAQAKLDQSKKLGDISLARPLSEEEIEDKNMSLWDKLVSYRYAATYYKITADQKGYENAILKFRKALKQYQDTVKELDELIPGYADKLNSEQKVMYQLDPNKADVYNYADIYTASTGTPQYATPGYGASVMNAARLKHNYVTMDVFAEGSTGVPGGLALINEKGTEAVITPNGTITALPSESGIVPADITKNVWQLGEVAPSILRALGYPNINNTNIGGSSSINNSDSLNIGTINMNVSADDTFDGEKFIQTLKQQASLNRNTRR